MTKLIVSSLFVALAFLTGRIPSWYWRLLLHGICDGREHQARHHPCRVASAVFLGSFCSAQTRLNTRVSLHGHHQIYSFSLVSRIFRPADKGSGRPWHEGAIDALGLRHGACLLFSRIRCRGCRAKGQARALLLYRQRLLPLVLFTVASQWDNYNGLLRMFYGLFPFLVLAYCVEKRGVSSIWSGQQRRFLFWPLFGYYS